MAEYEVLSSNLKASFYMTLVLTIVLLPKSVSTMDIAKDDADVSTAKYLEIVKRHLRWNSNGYIVSNSRTRSNIKIDYLQPHSRNVEVLDNGNYIAFTLYMRNGRMEEPNTGIFHFVDSDIAYQNRKKCSRETMHEGAYYHFYNKCPEEETNVVASGYCYQGSNGNGLVYRSYTFNSALMTYVDGQFYLDDGKVVNSYEQSLIRSCFESWKDSGFPVRSWNFSINGIPFASRLAIGSESTRSERFTGECDNCECTGVNGSPSNSHRRTSFSDPKNTSGRITKSFEEDLFSLWITILLSVLNLCDVE